MYDIKLRNTFAFRFSVLNKNYRSPEISPSGLTTAAELPRKRRIVMHETLRSLLGIKPNRVNHCLCQWHLRLSFQATVAVLVRSPEGILEASPRTANVCVGQQHAE